MPARRAGGQVIGSLPMMPSMPALKAESRTLSGKGHARRLRRTGLVPAIAYGKGLPSTSIAVVPKEVAVILRSELGKNTVLELQLDGKKLLAMIRDFTVHPVNRTLEHVDFVEVALDRPVDVDVPLIAVGKAVGVTKGGVLRVVHRVLPVRCLPKEIPAKIETDVAHLELGQHVATRDLKLPPGVTVRLAPEQTLVAVVAPEKEVEEVAPVAVAAVGAVAAPGAAPAAGGPAAPAVDAKKEEKKDEKKK
jgi:large subunit ribosomal protein L25